MAVFAVGFGAEKEGRALSAPDFSAAGAARSPDNTIAPDNIESVFRVKRVAVFARGLASVVTNRTVGILSRRDGLQVGRIHTRAVATEVVDFVSGWNGAACNEISGAMHGPVLLSAPIEVAKHSRISIWANPAWIAPAGKSVFSAKSLQ